MRLFLRKLHIWLGLATTVYLLVVAVTGVLLTHKKDLRLNETGLGHLQKLIKDLHTGAILGPFKTLVSDAFSIALVVVAVSGMLLWCWSWRRAR